MAAALGVRFLDDEGNPVSLNGEGLAKFRHIDVLGKETQIDDCQVLVACDVDNPLYGPNGAAHIFGPSDL